MSNLESLGTSGFVLLTGPDDATLRQAATTLADTALGSPPALAGHPDLTIADLSGEAEEIKGAKHHPKYLRWWTEPPAMGLRFFALPPRRSPCAVLLILGFDHLATADTSLSIQNRLLKPLEDLTPQHFVVATATRPHLILPTILSRARTLRLPAPAPDPAQLASLTAAAARWLEDAAASPARRLQAAAVLAPNPGRDGDEAARWWEEANQEPDPPALYRAVQALLTERAAAGDPAAAPFAQRLASWHALCEETNVNAPLQLAAVVFGKGAA